MPKLCCHGCGECFDPYPLKSRCPSCMGFLLPVAESLHVGEGRGVWRFSGSLASTPPRSRAVSLGEGGTPLIKAERLAGELGLQQLYVKDESRNPTGTFIDRGAATLVTAAVGQGYRRIAVASLGGDLAVSLGAYARHAGLGIRVILPRNIDLSKAYQAQVYADRVDYVDGYPEALRRLSKLGSEVVLPVDSSNPYLLDGYKTLYYEVYLELGRHPDAVVVPMGDGALLASLWQASRDLGGRPVFIGVRGCTDTPLLKDIASPRPLMSEIIDHVIRDSKGMVTEVCEDELLEAIRMVARSEGLLPDPIGVAAIAAAKRLRDMLSDMLVLAVATGGPLRDSAVLRMLAGRPELSSLGPTKLRILEIIVSRGPIHPYEVWRILKDNYRVRINLRTVYQHIGELAAKGYVKPAGRVMMDGRVRKLYEATGKGVGTIG